jgi:myosin heavy subunit
LNFAIDAIVLFSIRGELRRLPFNRNGINVITGESGTGKTAILDIVDYCFLASSHKISDSVINENVSWYGLELFVNGQEFFLARRAPVGNRVSDEYFFSQKFAEYSNPFPNMAEDDLKNLLETIFGIDGRATVPYGGRAIKAGSKLSFRYFLLFNTVSQDIITNSEVFFDRQNEERYREALPRIFDLALGIDDLANISAREKKEELLKEAARLRKKTEHVNSREKLFESETNIIARRAIEFGLMDGKQENPTSFDIRQMVNEAYREPSTGWVQRYNEISSQMFSINKRIRMLEGFAQETLSYKQTLGNIEDSLKPMMAILSRTDEVVKTDAFDDLISGLKSDLTKVKEEISRKKPVDGQVGDLIKALKLQRGELSKQLEGVPPKPAALQSEREKWLFIGETKGKLDTFVEVPQALAQSGRSLEEVESEAALIAVRDVDEERQHVIRAIEDVALELKNQIKPVLENYAEYIPIFNYKQKKLEMRKPRSALVENVGSSSNHMFMHLLHFMALQEVAISRHSRFVPSFLILDQPSRPYYGEEEKTSKMESLPKTDTGKITAAFQLLNDFIAHINNEYHNSFQMIVFEHVPVSIFKDMENVHLVEKFRDGIALIPDSWIATD